jgi:hypothetical protein
VGEGGGGGGRLLKEEPPMHPKSANDTSYICERSRQVHYAQRHRKEKIDVRHLQSVTISNNKASKGQ